MENIPPPGRLALSVGANAVASCDCGSNIFYPLVKINPGDRSNTLVALKCTVCDAETVIPFEEHNNDEKWNSDLVPKGFQS